MNEINISYIGISIGVGSVLGYLLFVAIKRILPRRLRKSHEEQRALVIEKAQSRKQQILMEAKKRSDEKTALLSEELETNLEEERISLEATEADLTMQEQFIAHEQDRIEKIESGFNNHKKKIEDLQSGCNLQEQELAQIQTTIQVQLAKLADVDQASVKSQIVDTHVTNHRLDSQKRIKELVDDLESHSKKGAERVLSRLLSRYQPSFVWPKSTNHVDIASPKLFDTLEANPQLLTDLSLLTEGVEISLSPAGSEGGTPIIRLGGGYGIYKEAARLTLEELLPKGQSNWAKCDKTYIKHKKALEIQALKLGRQAVTELKLSNIHEEIQKMIGALNWRTSYRQNQYYHSVEVSRLAGILASELGVDPDAAKRCGLLHDIGKGIDYRIEGSHAVISGDYADRFGERRLICDTVMSHHNDLVLETPLAFVLKSADTLSGARPGARINLEEGYQDRLAAMEEAIKSFPGIQRVAIMNGGREVHIGVNHKKIKEEELREFCNSIARKIEQDVAFPGQIKVLVTRRFEATSVA